MTMFQEVNLESWWAIFGFDRLSDLKKHCRKVTLHGNDLANIILFANETANGFFHLPFFRHHHPEHLSLSDTDLHALVSNGVGPMNEAARKSAGKIGQMFKERRLFSGHLFWFLEDPAALPKAWHFFHFDEKSTSATKSHWKHGSHLHLMNHLTHPNMPLTDLLNTLDTQERPWLTGGLHIRYER